MKGVELRPRGQNCHIGLNEWRVGIFMALIVHSPKLLATRNGRIPRTEYC